ncbi:MAG: hypothetical protein Q8Q04_00910 [archaeon]|nr:hypothetical protein [archaeon]
MENKIKSLAKKTGKFVVYAALINQLAKPTFLTTSANFISILGSKESAKKEVKYNPLLYKNVLSDSLSTLDYLNLSSYLTHKHIEEGEVCRHTANSTFELFQKFIERDKRNDLENKIRLGVGTNYRTGHMWIEYHKEGKWLPYETTNFVGDEILIRSLKKYSKENKHSKLNLDHKDLETFPGTKIYYPTLGSLLGFGLAEIPYGMLNNAIGKILEK